MSRSKDKIDVQTTTTEPRPINLPAVVCYDEDKPALLISNLHHHSLVLTIPMCHSDSSSTQQNPHRQATSSAHYKTYNPDHAGKQLSAVFS
jgi:hypothetical protein